MFSTINRPGLRPYRQFGAVLWGATAMDTRLSLRTHIRWMLLLCLWLQLIVQPSAVLGQIPGGVSPSSSPAPVVSEETGEQALTRLEKALTLARQGLTQGQKRFDSIPPEQLGATGEEVQRSLRLLNVKVLQLSQHVSAHRTREGIHQETEDLAARAQSWQGFSEPPPYSILMLDELRESRYTQHLSMSKDEIKKNFLEQEYADRLKTLEKAQQQLRLAKEATEVSQNGSSPLRRAWLYELAQLEVEVAEVRVLSLKTHLVLVDETLALHRKTIDFLDRQILVARSDSVFPKEVLDQKLAALDKKLATHEDFQSRAIGDSNRYQEVLQEARDALQKLQHSLESGTKDQPGSNEEVQRLTEEVEVKRAWVETGAKIVELNKVTAYLISEEKQLWTERYRLSIAQDANNLRESGVFIANSVKKIGDYRSIVESSHKLAQTLALNQKKNLEAGFPTEWQRTLAGQKLTAYEQRVDFLANNLEQIDELVQLAKHFQEDIADRRLGVTTQERLRAFGAHILEFARGVWSFEIFTVDDTLVINGQPVTESRPVTISKVVRALLILVIGLWLVLRLEDRINRLAARLFNLEIGAALLVQQVFKGVMVISLLLLAMTTVKIPLTIFAFMGGALAIGVGFGAQTLIGNFISGFILLFEKPIKVGDQVEVDGSRGRVVSIGARCSQVKRFDGIDILVPNSAFLEKNIVNYTLSDQLIRLHVKVGVAYGSPTRDVAKIIAIVLEEHGRILKSPEPVILFEDFGDSALVFSVYFWVEMLPTVDTRIVASDLRHMLDKRFREAGITIAFPQIDVHFDSDRPVQVQIEQKQRQTAAGSSSPGPEDEQKEK